MNTSFGNPNVSMASWWFLDVCSHPGHLLVQVSSYLSVCWGNNPSDRPFAFIVWLFNMNTSFLTLEGDWWSLAGCHRNLGLVVMAALSDSRCHYKHSMAIISINPGSLHCLTLCWPTFLSSWDEWMANGLWDIFWGLSFISILPPLLYSSMFCLKFSISICTHTIGS